MKSCTVPFLRIIANVSSILVWVHSNFSEERAKAGSNLETALNIAKLKCIDKHNNWSVN